MPIFKARHEIIRIADHPAAISDWANLVQCGALREASTIRFTASSAAASPHVLPAFAPSPDPPQAKQGERRAACIEQDVPNTGWARSDKGRVDFIAGRVECRQGQG